ncbi:MAG: hypothetical protein IJR85_01820 [Synergistaceae bacterium]|nr:hypothetical protein [Synergistaceae bacterium]
MFRGEPFPTRKGVVLWRKTVSEDRLWSTLFLEGEGIVNVSSKNMLGDSEPFVWGYFAFQKTARGKGYFLFEADIKDDMLHIRCRRDSIVAAMLCSQYLRKYLIPEQPDDSLLTNLYWCMKLLTVPVVPAEAAKWRFLRLWLEEWGLAPELEPFHTAKGFSQEEIILLSQVAALTYKGIIALFNSRLSPNIRENIFKVASELALNFFNET